MATTLKLLCSEALALLAFERARAPAFSLALLAWRHGLAWRWRRLRCLGWATHARLLRAEQACFRAGLAYKPESEEQRAPWHLPSRFTALAAAALPAHPLLDAELLAHAATGVLGAHPPALEALSWWLSHGAAAAPQRGLSALNVSQATDLSVSSAAGHSRVAVCMHLYYTELWPEMREQLAALPQPFDLLLTVPEFALTPRLQQVVNDCPQVRIVWAPNRGRDVLPWLRLLQQGAFDGYEFVCKLHGKHSPHTTQGQRWRQDSTGSLLGDKGNVTALLEALRADPAIGVLGPGATAVMPRHDAWQHQSQGHLAWLARRLAAVAGRGSGSGSVAAAAERGAWPFFAGTMFWFRPAALQPLSRLGLQPDDFAPEMGQTDGTLAHAIERFLAPVASHAGYRLAAWDPAARRAVPLAPTAAGSSPATTLLTGTS